MCWIASCETKFEIASEVSQTILHDVGLRHRQATHRLAFEGAELAAPQKQVPTSPQLRGLKSRSCEHESDCTLMCACMPRPAKPTLMVVLRTLATAASKYSPSEMVFKQKFNNIAILRH